MPLNARIVREGEPTAVVCDLCEDTINPEGWVYATERGALSCRYCTSVSDRRDAIRMHHPDDPPIRQWACGRCGSVLIFGQDTRYRRNGIVVCCTCADATDRGAETPPVALDPTVVCGMCGELYPENVCQAVLYNGDTTSACDECYREFPACDRCSNIIVTNGDDDAERHIHTEFGEQTWCESCADVYSNHCDSCGDASAGSSGTYYADDFYCMDCASEYIGTCHQCDETEHRDNLFWVESSEEDVCRTCYENHYRSCDDCGETYTASQLHTYNDGVDVLCAECASEAGYRVRPSGSSGPRTINQYTYKPPPNFFVVKKDLELVPGKFVCGVETEIETGALHSRNSLAQWFLERDTYGLFYLKSDSTIDHGFEVVSQPFSYDFMLKHPHAFDPLFALRKEGAHSYAALSCGMHVHVRRAGFMSGTHLYKFASMFFNNPSFVFRLSRRDKDSFDAYSNMTRYRELGKLCRLKNYGQPTERRAINFRPAETVEVRVFTGTINPKSWRANIEVCKAVFDYTMTHPSNSLSPDKFFNWAEREGQYEQMLQVYNTSLPAVAE